MASVYPGTDDYVAHLPEVTGAVKNLGKQVAAAAEAELAAVRARSSRTGRTEHASITVEQGATDVLISLEHPDPRAPVAIELGHTAADGSPVRGLNILGKAAGLK